MAAKTVQETIEKYRNEKLSFFPIPARSKKAAIEWKCYQERVPTEQEVNSWKTNGTANLAIVCGAVSGNLVVLDFDSHDKFLDYVGLLQDKHHIDLFTYTRVVTTARGNHIYFRLPQPIKSAKFPQLDVKAEGGYVMAPPSIHPDGAEYKFSNPEVPIRQIDDLKDVGIDIHQEEKTEQSTTGDAGEIIPPGSQDAWLFSRACSYRAKGDDAGLIIEKLRIDIRRCPPEPGKRPYNDSDFKRLADSACKYPAGNFPQTPSVTMETEYSYVYSVKNDSAYSGRDKSVTETVTKDRVLAWVRDTTGWWKVEELDKDLGIKTEEGKANRRQILKRLKDDDKLIEKHPRENSLWRYVNVAVRLIDFKSAGNSVPIAVKYPFGIERYFNTYPGNVIVLAGVTDTGKSTFLFNFIKANMYDFPIYYQSSEMGDTEIASRLKLFDDISLQDWNFTPEERSLDFADVIRPDAINIVDYLELTENFYLAAQQEKAIHEKLRGGIAIIAMQKQENASFAIGGILTASLPRLYLTIDKSSDGQIMRMKKAKNWVNPEVNPNRLAINYKIYAGSKLIVTRDWHEDEA